MQSGIEQKKIPFFHRLKKGENFRELEK